jgi:DNA-binding beta-propeller fold protein YncE
VRTAFALSYQHGDTPYEALVYTQTSPDIPKIMHDIEQYSSESGLGFNQPIVVDSADAFSWPWAWYLRDYHQVSFTDLSAYTTETAAYRPSPNSILLLNDADQAVMQQFRGQFGTGIPYHHRWWFPEDYRGTTATSLLASLAHGSTWSSWWGLLAGAHGIVKPPAAEAPGIHVIGSVDSTAYFPTDYVPGTGISAVPETAPAAKTAASGALITGGPGSAGGAFLRPTGLVIDSAGNFFVADSQNNRIEKFNSAGKLLTSSTDSSSPGGFQEPWDVAVDKQGMVYVADTWNHRIVKLDPQLHFLTAWGVPTKPSGPDSLLSLYGPRAIAFNAAGNLLVTDTGNGRVVEFTPDGNPISSFGSKGSGQGQFQEPVGIAVASDGTIYVADTWNGRVQVFDATGHYLRSLAVSGWESHDIENKPYLSVVLNGDVLITQPAAGRVTELNPNGSIVRNLTSMGADTPLTRPIGIATDGSGKVYVSDAGSNQVIRQAYTALP